MSILAFYFLGILTNFPGCAFNQLCYHAPTFEGNGVRRAGKGLIGKILPPTGEPKPNLGNHGRKPSQLLNS